MRARLAFAPLRSMVAMTVGRRGHVHSNRIGVGPHVCVNHEESVYFGFVAFTTLGFGDILLPLQWRLLGGMAAANGLLNFGLLTAVIVETLRQVRRMQRDATQDDIE
mgnify:CR=1 FL=1